MFCIKCGRRLPADDISFCPYCGADLRPTSGGSGNDVPAPAPRPRDHATANLEAFTSLLDERGLRYRTIDRGAGPVVVLGLPIEGLPQGGTIFAVDLDPDTSGDGDSVSIRAAAVVREVSPDRIADMLETLNMLSRRYRWVSYSMDDDDVRAQVDAWVDATDERKAAKTAFGLLLMMRKQLEVAAPYLVGA